MTRTERADPIHKQTGQRAGKFNRTALCVSWLQAGLLLMQMTSCSDNSRNSTTASRSACFALAGLALLISLGDKALAASARSVPSVQSIDSRAAGDPVMAIVSLRSQRIEIYDAQGWILRAPVSSGQKGRETPAGIFSVLQKDAEHYSNLYEEGYMLDGAALFRVQFRKVRRGQ